MKDIFGENNYRFGVESFLAMYLNKFKFVIGSDLEHYTNEKEIFDDGSPCNIYFVLRRPKITIDPKSVKIKDKIASFNILIQNKGDFEKVNIALDLDNASSDIEFHSEYPYTLFGFSDLENPLFVGRAAYLIENAIIKDNFNITNESLDYEVLYIGQAYGKDGSRNAIDRLSSHETLQKIYADTSTKHPDSDVYIMLANFAQLDIMMMAGKDLIQVSEEDSKIELKKKKHFHKNGGLAISEKQKINFTEAALIRYFQPEYNKEFKENFPTIKHKSYSECYELDIKAMAIELDISDNLRKLYNKKTKRADSHTKMFEFNSDEDRISLLSVLE